MFGTQKGKEKMLEIRKGSSVATQPIREIYTPKKIISHDEQIVKEDFLKDLRVSEKLSAKELVEYIKELCPGYDQALQHKCEHGRKYGITLRREAFNAVAEKFFPDRIKEIRRKRNGGHKLTKHIQCRLPDETYEKMLFFIDRAGYSTVQDWLTVIVQRYIAQEEKHIYTD